MSLHSEPQTAGFLSSHEATTKHIHKYMVFLNSTYSDAPAAGS